MEMEPSRFASYRRIVARGRHITLTLLRLPARQEGHPLTSVEPISHRHGDGARLADVRFCKPAAIAGPRPLPRRPRDGHGRRRLARQDETGHSYVIVCAVDF